MAKIENPFRVMRVQTSEEGEITWVPLDHPHFETVRAASKWAYSDSGETGTLVVTRVLHAQNVVSRTKTVATPAEV